jgi:hypothetical protein
MRNVTADTLANSKAWISISRAGIHDSYSEAKKFTEVPLEDVVVSGDTTWEGNALENRSIKLKSIISLPRDGIWDFQGYFKGNNWKSPLQFRLYGHYFAATDEIAILYKSDEMIISPLAYLEYFDYGTPFNYQFQNKIPSHWNSIFLIPSVR